MAAWLLTTNNRTIYRNRHGQRIESEPSIQRRLVQLTYYDLIKTV